MNPVVLAPIVIVLGVFAGLAPIGGYMQQARQEAEAHCSPNVGCELIR